MIRRQSWSCLQLWLGHYAHHLIIGMSMVTASLILIVPDLNWILIAAIIAGWCGVLVSVLNVVPHDFQVCDRCDDETAITDPEVQLSRRARLINYYHSSRMRPLMSGIASAIMCYVIAGVIFGFLSRNLITLTAVAAVFGIFAYTAYAELTHRRLWYWCPACEEDDDDDGDDGDDPVGPPGPSKQRTLQLAS